MVLRAIWLVSYDNGKLQQKNLREHGGHNRRVFRLPTPPWFVQRVLAADPEGRGTLDVISAKDRDRHWTPRIHGLCVVTTDGQLYDQGSFTAWGDEALLQKQYYDWPSDGFSVKVVNYFSLPSPVDVPSRRTLNGQAGLARASVSFRRGLLFYPHWVDTYSLLGARACSRRDGSDRCIADILASLRPTVGNAGVDAIPALYVPAPIPLLIAASRWSFLFCCASWLRTLKAQGLESPFGPWPPADWQQSALGLQPSWPDAEAAVLSPEALQGIARQLQLLAPRLLASHTGDVENEEAEEGDTIVLRDAIGTLSRWAFQQSALRGDFAKARVRNESTRLLHCIRLARLLRGGGQRLSEVVRRAACVLGVDPECFGGPIREIPSAASLQRHELSLDVALMIWESRRSRALGAHAVRWGLTDSSPQENRDWVWEQTWEMSAEDLAACFTAVVSLAADARSMSEADLSAAMGETPGVWHAWLPTIARSVRVHVSPPTAVTVGHRGIAHKAAAKLHSRFMECRDRSLLRAAMCCYRSHTSDMGTEFGLPDFLVRDSGLGSLLPQWFQGNVQMELDIAVAGDAEDVSDAQPSPDMECDVEGDSDCSGIAAAVAKQTQPQQWSAPPALLEDFGGMQPQTLMPNALSITGLQRVIDNLNT